VRRSKSRVLGANRAVDGDHSKKRKKLRGGGGGGGQAGGGGGGAGAGRGGGGGGGRGPSVRGKKETRWREEKKGERIKTKHRHAVQKFGHLPGGTPGRAWIL